MFNEKISEHNYHEFIDQIINVFRLSSFDKYILFSMKIENKECVIQLSILNSDGEKREYEDLKIDSSDSFFHELLDELVIRLRENCEITKEDIVNLDGDAFVAYRMITKFNDLITIDGLTEEEANHLLKNEEKETPKKELDISSNVGSSSLLGLLFMITFLVIAFIFVVTIVD